jgi:hypothetical protein
LPDAGGGGGGGGGTAVPDLARRSTQSPLPGREKDRTPEFAIPDALFWEAAVDGLNQLASMGVGKALMSTWIAALSGR